MRAIALALLVAGASAAPKLIINTITMTDIVSVFGQGGGSQPTDGPQPRGGRQSQDNAPQMFNSKQPAPAQAVSPFDQPQAQNKKQSQDDSHGDQLRKMDTPLSIPDKSSFANVQAQASSNKNNNKEDPGSDFGSNFKFPVDFGDDFPNFSTGGDDNNKNNNMGSNTGNIVASANANSDSGRKGSSGYPSSNSNGGRHGGSSNGATASSTANAGSGSAPPAGSQSGYNGNVDHGSFPADSFEGITLAHHNMHRKNHSVDALTWDPQLAQAAMTLSQRCNMAHDVTIPAGKEYGQNLATFSNDDPRNVGGAITYGFYNGEFDMIKWGSNSVPEEAMHLTQLVWKSSKTVGCAAFDCSGQGGVGNNKGIGAGALKWLITCNYSPPGNFMGEFGNEVNPPDGMPELHGNWFYPQLGKYMSNQ